MIFHPDTFLIGESVMASTPAGRALQGEAGAVRSIDAEGVDVIAGYAPVPCTSWGLVIEEPWSEIIETSRPYNRLMLGLLLLGVLVPVAVVALGVRRITRPLGTLTSAAKEVAAGNFDQRIEARTGDELETLAQQFNAMAEELQASYATLEQRVADRTKELATLNAIATVVSQSLELEEVMEAALERTLAAMALEAGAAFRIEEASLVLVAHRGFSAAFVQAVTSLPVATSVASEAQTQRSPVCRAVDAYPAGALKHLLKDEGVGSVISVPLIAKDDVLGVLNLVDRQCRSLTPEEISLLASIGRQTGLAIENARLYEQAESAAAAAERNRLARELHDAVSQTLFTSSLIAEVVPELWKRYPEEALRQLETLRRLTRGAMAEMRTLLLELRPAALIETELHALLGHLTRAVAARADVVVDLDLAPITEPPPDVKVALYRLAQEALNNVIKHAEADRVKVSLGPWSGEGIALDIADDGRGFEPGDVPSDHFGLMTMRERAAALGATFALETARGEGTRISVRWQPSAQRAQVRSTGSDVESTLQMPNPKEA